jgi:Arc/MetJ-type ribon-helix-helix transcriptional regulator
MSEENEGEEEKMVIVCVHMPKSLVEKLDELVKQGEFPSRSEAIREIIKDFLEEEGAEEEEEEEEEHEWEELEQEFLGEGWEE